MPFMEGDRVTVTSSESIYNGYWGTVTQYFGEFDFPKVEVKLDGYIVPKAFYDFEVAFGEHKIDEPEYEYNIRVMGQIFYTVWQTKEEMVALWRDGSFKGTTLQELKSHLKIVQPYWILVRRIKSEIEEV